MNDEELAVEARRIAHAAYESLETEDEMSEGILAALKKAREDGKVEGRIEIDREVEQLQLADWDRGRKLGMEEAAEIAAHEASKWQLLPDSLEERAVHTLDKKIQFEIRKRIAEIEKEKG